MTENHMKEAIITTAGSIENTDNTSEQNSSNQATEGSSATEAKQVLVNVSHGREEAGKAELDSQPSVTPESDTEVEQGARSVNMESSWTHVDTKVEDSKGQIRQLERQRHDIYRKTLSLKQKLRCQKEEIGRAENERQKRLCQITESENRLQQQLQSSKNDLQNIEKEWQAETEKQGKWENTLREQLKENEKAIQELQKEKLEKEKECLRRADELMLEESAAQLRIKGLESKRREEQSAYEEKFKIMQLQLEERRRVLNEIQGIKH
ncbi:hypothetical protein EC973_001496 [Apophysomyces ossiformis]|uniref:Uncharacterized protein n=1 Tax=Apophysomyces ossiformis TaxID=679940 RepID=A0A8H7BNW8_9FUNG|nr:hypothetical protein EC973_001496 [Apophysomyces ossiformis]